MSERGRERVRERERGGGGGERDSENDRDRERKGRKVYIGVKFVVIKEMIKIMCVSSVLFVQRNARTS